MSDIHIPRALDRHLVSAAHSAATAGDFAFGAFEAVVEQIARTLGEQGAAPPAVERALRDAFTGLGHAYQRTPIADRYAALEARAVSIAERTARRSAARETERTA